MSIRFPEKPGDADHYAKGRWVAEIEIQTGRGVTAFVAEQYQDAAQSEDDASFWRGYVDYMKGK